MRQRESLNTLIPLKEHNGHRIRGSIMTGINGLLEKILSVDKVRSIYDTLPLCSDPFEFIECTLDRLRIDYRLDEKGRGNIPSSGPAIVVANHPFGGIDGLILASALSAVRKDIKILVNYFLEKIEDLRPIFFPVDPFESDGSKSRNAASVRKAVRWVKGGGMLVILPAGEVSHFTWKRKRVEDPAWSPVVGGMVRLTHAPVLPVYFKGRNSAVFQAAGLAHPILRTAMLPRETLKKKGSEVHFTIGQLIPYKNLEVFENASRLTEYLRFRTYLLGMAKGIEGGKARQKMPWRDSRKGRPIAEAVDAGFLGQEVRSLPDVQYLASNADLSVHYARSGQIPMILREIGRLREHTFRGVNEGTGRSIDLDRFDNIYTHLFVWNRRRQEIVGAYRLGPSLEILSRHGKRGLYTHTLFKYRNAFLNEIGPALELGRTFIRAEYQRDYAPLLLLWKGIGQYIARHPHYRTLFGAVSISSGYGHYSRQLMAAFLKVNTFSPDLSRMVKPRKPFRGKKVISLIREKEALHRNDLNELSSWISAIEEDGKGVPILLKQYLKLGGKVLAFNLDTQFGDTLDGLMVVDLMETDRKVLKRYMGADGFQGFVDYHSDPGRVTPTDSVNSLSTYANA